MVTKMTGEVHDWPALRQDPSRPAPLSLSSAPFVRVEDMPIETFGLSVRRGSLRCLAPLAAPYGARAPQRTGLSHHTGATRHDRQPNHAVKPLPTSKASTSTPLLCSLLHLRASIPIPLPDIAAMFTVPAHLPRAPATPSGVTGQPDQSKPDRTLDLLAPFLDSSPASAGPSRWTAGQATGVREKLEQAVKENKVGHPAVLLGRQDPQLTE